MARRRGRDGPFALGGRVVQGRIGAGEGARERVRAECAGHVVGSVVAATDERERSRASVSAAWACKLRARQRSIVGQSSRLQIRLLSQLLSSLPSTTPRPWPSAGDWCWRLSLSLTHHILTTGQRLHERIIVRSPVVTISSLYHDAVQPASPLPVRAQPRSLSRTYNRKSRTTTSYDDHGPRPPSDL